CWVSIAGGIGGAHLEGVVGNCQAAIGLRARTRSKGSRIKLAGKSAAGLRGGEAEAGAGAVGGCRWICGDRGVGWSGIGSSACSPRSDDNTIESRCLFRDRGGEYCLVL